MQFTKASTFRAVSLLPSSVWSGACRARWFLRCAHCQCSCQCRAARRRRPRHARGAAVACSRQVCVPPSSSRPGGVAALKFTSEKPCARRSSSRPSLWRQDGADPDESSACCGQAAAERAGLQKSAWLRGRLWRDRRRDVVDSAEGMGRMAWPAPALRNSSPAPREPGPERPQRPGASRLCGRHPHEARAEWAEDRIATCSSHPTGRAMKIREGVSVYYNLSIKGATGGTA
jgi:hypothetical protein